MVKLRKSEIFRVCASFLTVSFIFAFVILSGFAPPLYSQQTDIDKLLDDGKKAYMDGDYEKAVRLLNQAISLIKNKSKLIDAYLSLALTYFTINQLDRATEQIQNVLKLNPSFKPDPEFYSPKFIKLFDDVKKKNIRDVEIVSIPEGARIFIDDEDKGITPFVGGLYLGKHTIRIVKEGYEILEKEISIDIKGANKFTEELKPLPAPVVQEKIEEKPISKERVEESAKKKKSSLLFLVGGALVAGVVIVILLAGKKKEEKPKIANISVTFSPNPVPNPVYDNGKWRWYFTVTLKENNGVGASFSDTGPGSNALKVDFYPGGNYTNTSYWKASEMSDWFGSQRIQPYGTLSVSLYVWLGSNSGRAIFTFYFTDDNGNRIEASGTVNFSSSLGKDANRSIEEINIPPAIGVAKK